MTPSFGPLLDGIGIWLTCLLTLAVFSFLYRDNPFYKFAEHLYVGVAAGYYFYQAFRGTIFPNLFQHVYLGIQDIAAGKPAWASQWRWGALVMGLLILSRLVPKWSWVSRWPMGLIVGAFAGLNLIGFAQANLIDQIHATFLPVVGHMPGTAGSLPFLPVKTPGDPSILNHLVLIVGVLSVLTYFLFSTQKRNRFNWFRQLGIAFVMVTFGATYGSIVLARVSLLIGRVQTLTEANRPEYGYPPISSAVILVLALAVWRVWFYVPEEAGEPQGHEETKA